MGFNLRKYGNLLEKLTFNDKCTITRLQTVKNQYGATDPNSRVEIYKDINCKFSFKNIDTPNDSNGVFMPVVKEVTVFVLLDYDIKAGDIITGFRKDTTSGIKQPISGKCGEPNRFDTHQEIPIEIDKEN